jgi:hypothetical protein
MAAGHGDSLRAAIRVARGEVLLVSPYVKREALDRVLLECGQDVSVRLVTRWRLEELASGVSDLDAWESVMARRGASWWNHPTLHAKYYRADERVFAGSANLTGAGLGWSREPNLETLLNVTTLRAELAEFEAILWRDAVRVDASLYDAFATALREFPAPPMTDPVMVSAERQEPWRPTMRFPKDMFRFYSGDVEDLTAAAREAAAADLSALAPPSGMTRSGFDAWVSLQLRQHAEVRAMEGFACQPRRFGEMRDFLAQRGAADPERAWQSWMRWLQYFLPGRYLFTVPNHSELFALK